VHAGRSSRRRLGRRFAQPDGPIRDRRRVLRTVVPPAHLAVFAQKVQRFQLLYNVLAVRDRFVYRRLIRQVALPLKGRLAPGTKVLVPLWVLAAQK